MKALAALLLVSALPLFSQSNSGELRLQIGDPAGRGLRARILIESQANQYSHSIVTSDTGEASVRPLPYGIYLVSVALPGFAPLAQTVEIRSSLPTVCRIRLKLPSVNQSVLVSAAGTLIDPDQAGSESQIGLGFIQERPGSVPGRGLQDLVDSQPGWLYEGNAVLHPRGSEYQTQIVVDGIPLTDNRSPSFGPEIETDDIASIGILTAGIPAEYGRKMGGVVEVNTLTDVKPGFHGDLVLSGGSFDSAGAFAHAQYAWARDSLGASAGGSRTGHYLNPVVPQNYSNTGTLGDFSLDYARDFTPRDRLRLLARHELSLYDIPNEQVQQAAGQRQTADNVETLGMAAYEHALSSRTLLSLRGMVRDNANGFRSNAASTPIQVFQANSFREGYFNAQFVFDRGRHEWKLGAESDATALHENLSYLITDPTQFDDGSPLSFAFQDHRPDLEQSAYLQDRIRFAHWTVGAGLRWDHYQLLLNRHAVEPRLAVSRYFPSAATVLHFSYDRVFQTPSFENILLSSSPAIASIDPQGFLRLPVAPSQGDYFEAGAAKAFWNRLRLSANVYRRVVDNFADDSQIENTTVSFPISFRKAIVYGAEAKLDLPQWRRISGFASYSYMLGNAWFPVTGGLFFGAGASDAASQLSGHFPDSQDQRNTLRARFRLQAASRLWFAAGLQYDSGLPFDFDGDPSTVLAEYGPQILSRIDFNRGRIDPAFQASASAGADLYQSERLAVHFQADGQNLNNVLNVIDFGGLFSGNAIGPPRSFALRLTTTF